VAETGTHLELLDRGGIYAGLCRLQLAPAPIVTLEAADA